jgi:hypothetical protein
MGGVGFCPFVADAQKEINLRVYSKNFRTIRPQTVEKKNSKHNELQCDRQTYIFGSILLCLHRKKCPA